MAEVSGMVAASAGARVWVERLTLTDFRNHARLSHTFDARPVVLTGPNGAGKTNLIEAISLLAPGQGLRRAPYPEIARRGADAWAVAARVHTPIGPVDIGTGLTGASTASNRAGRTVRIDGEAQSGSGILAEYVEMVWLTPAMDGLFTGAGGDRRRFLDRMILCFDPGYRTRVNHFERAMAQRNRLLEEGVRDNARLEGLEIVMAETGVAMAAARAQTVAALATMIEARRDRTTASAFPWAKLELEGELEAALAVRAAVEVEDAYARTLASVRERDRAAGRALDGPHRSDLVVGHGPKDAPARQCSTGEQKALLVGLILAHAELMAERRRGAAPILLLDEIAAHLDAARRAALFDEIIAIGTQAWMTGTDLEAFSALGERAQRLTLGEYGTPQ
ncbi:DNA replication/repair protein RecF [Hyphomicrobium sp. CS1BSMeth3]|uniref:DNA replication/repair protein RecF n=1 Tax=Hyphomicrobium sp. CS1BSMeth3 TaxID=1892844 RepID=UPI001FCDFF85|nr:DNA replication/repair protein RecF [Hyphomicrobium sp. CS1BSMeth3]